MNIGKLIPAIVAVAFTAGLMCNDKPVNSPPPTVVGTWDLAIPPITNVTQKTLNVMLNINDDSKFTLELNEESAKILYNSEGTWTATGDSIYLHSSKCLVIDTVADPDSLKNLSDSLCALPIPLKLPENNQNWDIKTEDLTIMLSGFPVPKDILNLIPFVLPILPMEKRPTE